MSAPLVRLADCCEIVSGATPSTSVQRNWGGDIAWATPKDLSDLESKYLSGTPQTLTQEGYDNCSAKLMPAGSVLFSSRAPIGHVAINAIPMCTNQGFKSFVPDAKRLSADYLYYWLKANKAYLQSLGNGATFKELSKATVSEVQIPLPSVSEQRRIAAILDKADALRAKRREAIGKLDELLESVFLDTFGDQKSNTKNWQTRRVDEVTVCLDRLRRPVTAKDRKPGNVPYYGANGQQGFINEAIFNEPLVLVAEDGGHFNDPRRGVAYRIDGPAWVNNHAHILRAREGVLDTEYLHRALRHYDFAPFISGTTRAKLTQGQLNGAPILVPPLDLQLRFSQRVEHIRKVGLVFSTAGDRQDSLFESLQRRAFLGEL